MAKVLKIGGKKSKMVAEAVKTAKPGAATTGAKVTKTKAGSGKVAENAVGRLLGKTSNLTIAKYQNLTLEQNRKKRLTDEQLAKLWCEEHPQSKAVMNGNIDASMVAAVRNNYNLGKHGNDAPAVPIPRFDESGQPMPFHGEKTAAKREASETRKTIERVKSGAAPKGAVKKLKK